ncbi:response regulator transcription factor [Aquincola sp. S2]|uniref:Response regulator transcription factor n=1 Tax=Pseudaquabacterium terrae TaxID=2732868 RepID=A0ABX2ETX8_9BURK|nr:LuxR C-terminal-related transcriptional regulator [Aquabacterium terrae]NRF71962.1 response regulator transcription factor [Aquabacterium terrae]
MQIGRQTLEVFSGALMDLATLPPSTSPSRLMSQGLAALAALVPHDAAWWGECSGGIDGLAPRNWLSGRVKLGPDFAREWNRIGASDRFALDSIGRLDTVVCSHGFEDPVPAVEAFARRHDLFSAMAITRVLPGSGLLQFISLYRGAASPPFEAAHRVVFKHFSAHLMQRWSARIAELLAGSDLPGSDAQGLVDARGEFAYLGARLALLLRERFPQWNGTSLPDELAEAAERRPNQLTVGRRRLLVQPCGDLLLLSLQPQRRAAILPPRELKVARQYAEGHSYKQIARDTGLSPATVRTYVRDAYLRLGVSDKVALGRVLNGPRARRRTG